MPPGEWYRLIKMLELQNSPALQCPESLVTSTCLKLHTWSVALTPHNGGMSGYGDRDRDRGAFVLHRRLGSRNILAAKSRDSRLLVCVVSPLSFCTCEQNDTSGV